MHVSLANMRAEANCWLSSRAAFTQCGHILRWRPCELATLLNVGICRGDLSEANETSEDKPASNWSARFFIRSSKNYWRKVQTHSISSFEMDFLRRLFLDSSLQQPSLKPPHPPPSHSITTAVWGKRELFLQKCLNSLIPADPKRNRSQFPSALSEPPHGIKPSRMSFRNQRRILISLENIYKSLSDFNLRFSEHSCYNVVIKEFCRLNC